MRITHEWRGKTLHAEAKDPSFMLTDKRGSFLWLSPNGPISKYNGSFFAIPSQHSWEMMKSIEHIHFSPAFDHITDHGAHIDLTKENARARFFMDANGMVCDLMDYEGDVSLFLDCRKMHDFDDQGRMYMVQQNHDTTLISYRKEHTPDPYECHIAMKGVQSTSIGHWIERHYPFDEHRKDSRPLYVYHALDMKSSGHTRFAISASLDKNQAMSRAVKLHQEYPHLYKAKHRDHTHSPTLSIPNTKLSIAYAAAVAQLDGLIQDIDGNKGIFAGLPWFSQYWVRDEAISLGALIKEQRGHEALHLLKRYLPHIDDSGRMPNYICSNYPTKKLLTADGLGWVCHRLLTLLKMQRRIPFDELEDLADILLRATDNLKSHHGKDEFIQNMQLETWMDTSAGNDDRSGFRIEIQAGFLAQLQLLVHLLHLLGTSDAHEWELFEHSFAHSVRQRFFQDHLKDGLHDPTLRPNVFLAHYLYPKLLTTRDWQKTFDAAVEHLWCGHGFTTIDRRHSLFQKWYTGTDNKSYHRGDSWFWVNNLAAISLSRINAFRYRDKINRIIDASSDDILQNGIIGHHSELSSAEKLTADGCLSQAWSAAMFIELMHERFGNKNFLRLRR
ncbi:MAG: amylo-alpha-1,6-glucosidase [Nanoarchaeota archaeon]